MMQLSTLLLGSFLFLSACFAPSTTERKTTEVAKFDVEYPLALPRDFRTSNDLGGFGDNDSLMRLYISGSGQFTATNLPTLLSKIPKRNVVVVDLKEESHGFINGIPISWVGTNRTYPNAGKTVEEIEANEARLLEQALQSKDLIVMEHRIPKHLTVFKTSTERELVNSFGVGYFRVPVTDLHKPAPEQIDRFVSFVQQLPPNTWLHFHCKMGQGRTTTFMVLYDIMKNGAKTHLDTIIKRQYKLGGANLYNLHDASKPKHQWAVDRLEFIKQFYRYSYENPDYKIPFSVWIKQKNV